MAATTAVSTNHGNAKPLISTHPAALATRLSRWGQPASKTDRCGRHCRIDKFTPRQGGSLVTV
jgi:hypothetical protein